MRILAHLTKGASPFGDPHARHVAGRFGMSIFLVSVSALFVAGIVGFIVVRLRLLRDGHWPTDLPPLPWPLWISTIALLASSATITAAIRALRRDRLEPAAHLLLITTQLGLLFLVLQAWCWFSWLGAVIDRWGTSAEYRLALTGFFVLTGVHALHLIGGLVPLVIATVRARHRRYSSQQHGGVVMTAMYWHFLDVVWLVLFATLLLLVR